MNAHAETGRLRGVRAIAVLRANAVGDLVFALPALDALRHAYPDARITLLARAWHAQFLRGRPCGIDEVVEIPRIEAMGAGPRAGDPADRIEAFFARMQERRFDLAFQLHGGGARSNPFVRRLRARCSIGAFTPDAERLDRGLPYQPLQNERLRLLELVALAGARPHALAPTLPATARDRHELAQAWREGARPYAVLQPGAQDPRRRWPPERFAAVGDALAARGLQVVINGTEAEREATRAVASAMRAMPIDLTAVLSLSGLAALLAGASLLVSNDTGPLHLAHALGTPCVGIYWLTNLVVSAPLAWDGTRSAVALSPICPECGALNLTRRCAHDPSFVAEVGVDEVLRLADELLTPHARPKSAGAGAPRRAPRPAPAPADPTRPHAACGSTEPSARHPCT